MCVCVCVHTCIHTYIHMYVRTYITYIWHFHFEHYTGHKDCEKHTLYPGKNVNINLVLHAHDQTLNSNHILWVMWNVLENHNIVLKKSHPQNLIVYACSKFNTGKLGKLKRKTLPLCASWLHTVPLMFDFNTRWRLVVSLTPWPLYHQWKSPWYLLSEVLGEVISVKGTWRYWGYKR